MTWIKVPEAAVLDERLSGVRLRVLLYLSWRQGAKDESWPSLEKMAAELRVSRRSVQLALVVLQKGGYIKRTRDDRPGHGNRNTYEVILEKGATDCTLSDPEKDDMGDTLPTEKGSENQTLSTGDKGSEKQTLSASEKGATDCAYSSEKGATDCAYINKEGAIQRQKKAQSDDKSCAGIRKNKSLLNKSGHSALAEGFGRFWLAYPKKVKKVDALKAWKSLSPDGPLVGIIMAALEVHKRSNDWGRDGGQFIPYPASWLRGRRWEDETWMAPPTAAAAPVALEIDNAGLTALENVKIREGLLSPAEAGKIGRRRLIEHGLVLEAVLP